MDFLFDLKRQRTVPQAVLFYICHLIVGFAGAAAVTLITTEHATSQASANNIAYTTGQVFAIVYVTVLCARAVMQRNFPPVYYGAVVLALPVAYYLGTFGGLIIASILVALPDANSDATQAVTETAVPAPAPVRLRKPRSQFGQRAARS